jgi:hypothetical protein
MDPAVTRAAATPRAATDIPADTRRVAPPVRRVVTAAQARRTPRALPVPRPGRWLLQVTQVKPVGGVQTEEPSWGPPFPARRHRSS